MFLSIVPTETSKTNRSTQIFTAIDILRSRTDDLTIYQK